MKKITLFLLLGLISFSAVTAQDVTLEDLWLRYKYYPQSGGQFEWMTDDHYYSTLEAQVIKQNNIEQKDGSKAILELAKLDFPEGLDAKAVTAYSFNADETKLLLTANSESIYRHSSREQCLVYDRNSKGLNLLHKGEKIGNATFSHDSKKVAYTYNNDLFFQNLDADKQTQITSDGKTNSIINGSTDWVYEEEFGFIKAFAWSPDDRYVQWSLSRAV